VEPGALAEHGSARAARGFGRVVDFFHRHPIVALAVLTPGIPEYLSTSSPVLNLVVNPGGFFLQLAINVGQYTAGALLVREAYLRWGKGWTSVALLAGAYGITEEGLGDSTLFNSNHGADGVLGSYGRFAGVNWVWSTGVLLFHVIYSIGLPILLLGLALPETRRRSLIGRRGVAVAFATLALSTALENRIVYADSGFWIGTPPLLAAFAAIGLLVLAARRAPAALAQPARPRPTLSTRTAGVVGFAVFPIAFLLEYGGPVVHAPALGVLILELGIFALLFEALRRGIGRTRNEAVLVALAFGFVLWQSVFAILLTLGLPYPIALIAVAVVFFVRLRHRYPAGPPAAAA
jgi:hypothetical protein